ncbi:MAG: hypothetical protein SO253_02665 [Bacilli bacterium]|nr:hypothetical protein [Bacilli bacterium]
MVSSELLNNPLSKMNEAYRRVKINLDNHKNYKKLQITSSSQVENSVNVAFNLAKCYIEENRSVLILDFTSSQKGLSDSIINKTNCEENITDYQGIKYLCGGSLLPSLTILLQINENIELINMISSKFDLVIIVTSSIILSSLPLLIDKVSDGCIFIVSKAKTNKELAKEAITSLKRNNVKIIGTIVTDNK